MSLLNNSLGKSLSEPGGDCVILARLERAVLEGLATAADVADWQMRRTLSPQLRKAMEPVPYPAARPDPVLDALEKAARSGKIGAFEIADYQTTKTIPRKLAARLGIETDKVR